MIFNRILKLADSHIQSMLKDKSINKKKREIAKYSFIVGFKTAMMLYDETRDGTDSKTDNDKSLPQDNNQG